eukprot:519771_1
MISIWIKRLVWVIWKSCCVLVWVIWKSCSFYNITRTYNSYWNHGVHAMMELDIVNISQTSFHNIVLNPPAITSSQNDVKSYAFIQINSDTLISTAALSLHMEHCSIINYKLSGTICIVRWCQYVLGYPTD